MRAYPLTCTSPHSVPPHESWSSLPLLPVPLPREVPMDSLSPLAQWSDSREVAPFECFVSKQSRHIYLSRRPHQLSMCWCCAPCARPSMVLTSAARVSSVLPRFVYPAHRIPVVVVYAALHIGLVLKSTGFLPLIAAACLCWSYCSANLSTLSLACLQREVKLVVSTVVEQRSCRTPQYVEAENVEAEKN